MTNDRQEFYPTEEYRELLNFYAQVREAVGMAFRNGLGNKVAINSDLQTGSFRWALHKSLPEVL